MCTVSLKKIIYHIHFNRQSVTEGNKIDIRYEFFFFFTCFNNGFNVQHISKLILDIANNKRSENNFSSQKYKL